MDAAAAAAAAGGDAALRAALTPVSALDVCKHKQQG
jgi:hypothetical protein